MKYSSCILLFLVVLINFTFQTNCMLFFDLHTVHWACLVSKCILLSESWVFHS